MTVAGDPRAVPTFLRQLAETEFKGQSVKLRMRGGGGQPVITTLADYTTKLQSQSNKAQ
jgi:hypothetical protein